MSNIYKLVRFINVFGIMPTFLLPVFALKGKPFFQVIENDVIREFIEADMTVFSGCEQIQVECLKDYTINDRALYALQLHDRSIVIGDSLVIRAFWIQHKSVLSKQSNFTKKMLSFLQETKVPLALPPSYNNPPSTLQESDSFHDPIVEALENVFFQPSLDLSDVILSNYRFDYLPLQSERLIENQSVAVFLNSEPIKTVHSIFTFYDLTKRKHTKYIPRGIIRYWKSNNYPISIQLEVIDVLLNYTPTNYFHSRNRGPYKHYRLIKVELPLYRQSVAPNLWTSQWLRRLYNRKAQQHHINQINISDIHSIINSWRLPIKTPLSKTDSLSDRASWWKYYLLANERDIFDGTKKVCWLQIKKLSDMIQAIVAQDFFSKEIYFQIVDGAANDLSLIRFIKGLYEDVNKKLSFLLIEDNGNDLSLTERFAEWLCLNEEICEFSAYPQNLNTK